MLSNTAWRSNCIRQCLLNVRFAPKANMAAPTYSITGDVIIGTGAIKRVDDRECEMTRMFVAAPYRGRGIGCAIVDHLIEFARRTGYDRISLSSNNALAASHRLYEKTGFQPTSPWDPSGGPHSRYYVLKLSD
jgi:GNAT superfamily N-acetyltransferase